MLYKYHNEYNWNNKYKSKRFEFIHLSVGMTFVKLSSKIIPVAACDIALSLLFTCEDCPEFLEAIITTFICNNWIPNCDIWQKLKSNIDSNICKR